MRFPKVWLIWLLLAAFGVLLGLMELAGGSTDVEVLLRFGAEQRDLVLAGQWWRLLSSGLLHIGIVHLLVNGYSLVILGRALEEQYGSRALWALFAVSVVGGGATSMLFNNHVGAGASGGIFGLMGAYVAHYLRWRRRMTPAQRQAIERWLGSIVVMNLLVAISIPNIGHAAHLGGLAAGTLTAFALQPAGAEGRLQKVATWAVAVASMSALLLAAWNAGNERQGLWEVTSKEWRDPQGRWSMTIPGVMTLHHDPEYEAAVGPGAAIMVQVVPDYGTDDWMEIEKRVYEQGEFTGTPTTCREVDGRLVARGTKSGQTHETWHVRAGLWICRIRFYGYTEGFSAFEPAIARAMASLRTPAPK